MKFRLSEPGVLVSGGAHLVALLLLIVTFTKPQQFDPMQETVQIETVSDKDFNQVMEGQKTASVVQPAVLPKVDQAEPTPDPKPTPTPVEKPVTPPPPPPAPEPVKQVPPPPPERPPPPVAETQPTPPTPPSRPAPAPSVPMPPERVDADAEPVQAKPVPQPPRPPDRVAEAKPLPPVKPHPPKPRPPKPDQLAKVLDMEPTNQTPEKPVPKPPTKARPEQQSDSHTFDLTDISRLLSHDTPAQKAAPGREQSKLASLGSPTAHAEKMAPSLWGQLDGLMEEQYRQCWSYLGLNPSQKYVPQIRVTYDESGGLNAEPVLVNPPNDPALRSLADSALRAVRRCNPLRIPAQYAPYYDEWKGRVLRFDPEEMAG